MFSAQSVKSTVKYRSKYYAYAPDNTLLHDALHENNTALALQSITDDIINTKSLGNTPLLFALKKGNMAVAEALLKHSSIDVFSPDSRGLTALHWACMLRQDKIIEMLLDKKADPYLKVERWVSSDISEPFNLTPIALYERNVLIENFTYYYLFDATVRAADERAQGAIPLYGSFFDSVGSYQPGFIDRSDLYIPGEMAYTDIIFYVKDLCNNLSWKKASTHFVDAYSSMRDFSQNFSAGINDFCQYRNAISLNKKLLDKMQKVTEYKSYTM